MRVLIAPDKFAGTLTAVEAAEAIAEGWRRRAPRDETVLVPMADGGPGFCDVLHASLGGDLLALTVSGPYGDPVPATVLLTGETAYVESAQACGLHLTPREQRDPGRATSSGVGELLAAGVDAGARRIVVGLGGSATNDGGAGLLAALGYRLLDQQGEEIAPTGGGLQQLQRIDSSARDCRLDDVVIDVACDVTNPLLGPTGASLVFGPQKGADANAVELLEGNLTRWAAILRRDLGRDVAAVLGAGAAGGLGAGLLAVADARLKRGVELVIEAVGLREALLGADLCLTGEGALDGQTAFGKTAEGVARTCRSLGVPCVVVAGSLRPPLATLHDRGVTAFFSSMKMPASLSEAVAFAPAWIADTTEQVVRLFAAARTGGGAP
jgi:glycerate kinase